MPKLYEHTPETCRAILRNCNVNLGTDFHSLGSTTVESLVAWANRYGYRQPKNANGSRARYYHDMLQRKAARKESDR